MTSGVSRIQIVEAPPAAPGHCALCGTTRGPMVDFGMELEFFGVVYFCIENCLTELANSFEYHSPRQWKMLMNQIDDQRNELNQLRDQNEQLRSDLGSIARLSGLSDISRTPELDVDSLRQEPEQLSFDFNSGDSEREERPAKSNDEPGSSDVRDDFSVDDFLRNL